MTSHKHNISHSTLTSYDKMVLASQIRDDLPSVVPDDGRLVLSATIDPATRAALFGPRDWIVECTYTRDGIDIVVTEYYACGLHYSVSRRTCSVPRVAHINAADPFQTWFAGLDRCVCAMSSQRQYTRNGDHQVLYEDGIFIGLETHTFRVRLTDLALLALYDRCRSDLAMEYDHQTPDTSLGALVAGYWFRWKTCPGSRLLSRVESLIRCDN